LTGSWSASDYACIGQHPSWLSRSGGTVSDNLIMLATASCGDDACPTVYLDNGRLIIQGDAVSTADLPRVAPGEGAVSIGIETIRQALARYDAGGLA
jgi:hypothetical protein